MNLDKKVIVQSGDSWAAGTWDKDSDYPRPNEGIAKLFADIGYEVRNLAKPGGSNLESVARLSDFLACNASEVKDIKFILFWQTEFFREMWYYQYYDNIYTPLEKELEHGYAKLKEHWVYRPYYRLSEISQKWNVPIYVIGGCSDTVWYDDFNKDFPGVTIICQSVTNLLVTGNHRIDNPVFCQFVNGWIDRCDFLETIKDNASSFDLETLLDDMELGQHRLQTFSKHPNWFGDDCLHPNQSAHLEVFKFLVSYIPELGNKKVDL